jgi:bisphosphoglycerate-independent phosphoglycerate mutase (AlkP superfamily)
LHAWRRCRVAGRTNGHSEVGHLNIGAGRIVKGDLLRISEAIADGTMTKALALLTLIERLRQSGGACHLQMTGISLCGDFV